METKFKIRIPEPCHENWQTMNPEENGRFCSVCTKTVIDFTTKSEKEIQTYLEQNKGKKICGRFKNDQINTFDIQIPQSLLRQPMPFQKAFLLMLFIAMGSTLFSCKNHKNDSLDKVVLVEDSVETHHTLGIVLPSVEANPEKKLGTVVSNKDNSKSATQIPTPPKSGKVNCTKGKKHLTTSKEDTEIFTTGIMYIEPKVLKAEEPTRIDSLKNNN